MLPAEAPIKMSAEVHFCFVSPAVFCADQEYINGAAMVSLLLHD